MVNNYRMEQYVLQASMKSFDRHREKLRSYCGRV